MFPNEHDRADALEEAIAALRTGAALEDVGLRLDASEAPLLHAAAGLGEVASPVGPSATFVLGLEEQLRTDFRLGLTAGRPARNWARRGATVWLAGLGAALLVFGTAVLVARSRPGDALYPVKDRIEALALAASPRADQAGAVAFEQGRLRLQEVTRAVQDENTSAESLDDLLDELFRLYAAGAAAAAQSADGYAQSRAHGEVQAAEVALMRLGEVAEPADRAALGGTRAALKRLLEPPTPVPGNGVATPVAPVAPNPSPTQQAGTAPPGSTPTQDAPAPTRTSVVLATPTATLTPSPSSTAVPPATGGPRDPDPTDTAVPPTEPVDPPGAVAPTPTRDVWPTDTPPAPIVTAPPVFPPPASSTPPAGRDR